MKLKTIIVEDDASYQKLLSHILKSQCPEKVEVVDITSTVDQSVKSIKKHKPQLVFLDIQLKDDADGGFEILRNFDEIDFMIVFTTGDDSSTNILSPINAFDAVKYLVKPFKPKDVVESVNKVKQNFENKNALLELNVLKKFLDQLVRQNRPKRVAIRKARQFIYLPYQSVIMMQANGNGSDVFTEDCKSTDSIDSLKEYENKLPKSVFLRTSQSFLINLNHVKSYSTEDGGIIYLSCGHWVPLRRNRDDFFDFLK
jgi:two-component system LytT family response regulator